MFFWKLIHVRDHEQLKSLFYSISSSSSYELDDNLSVYSDVDDKNQSLETDTDSKENISEKI